MVITNAASWQFFYPGEGEPLNGFTVQQWTQVDCCFTKDEAEEKLESIGDVICLVGKDEGLIIAHAKVRNSATGEIEHVSISRQSAD